MHGICELGLNILKIFCLNAFLLENCQRGQNIARTLCIYYHADMFTERVKWLIYLYIYWNEYKVTGDNLFSDTDLELDLNKLVFLYVDMNVCHVEAVCHVHGEVGQTAVPRLGRHSCSCPLLSMFISRCICSYSMRRN